MGCDLDYEAQHCYHLLMDVGSLGFLITTVAAVMAIGLPLGVAAWRRRKSLQRNTDVGR